MVPPGGWSLVDNKRNTHLSSTVPLPLRTHLDADMEDGAESTEDCDSECVTVSSFISDESEDGEYNPEQEDKDDEDAQDSQKAEEAKDDGEHSVVSYEADEQSSLYESASEQEAATDSDTEPELDTAAEVRAAEQAPQ